MNIILYLLYKKCYYKYSTIFRFMRVRILKTKLVEVVKTRLDETWDKQLNKWDELSVETIQPLGKTTVNLITTDGDIYLHIPTDLYEILSTSSSDSK